MKANVTASNSQQGDISRQSHHGGSFAKVLDGRKQPIRGLWVRNGRFYARLNITDGNTGKITTRRVSLVDKDHRPVSTVAQAGVELNRLKNQKGEGTLPVLHRTPKFSEYADQYLAYYKTVTGAKRPKTLQTEAGHLNAWKAHLGDTRIDRIHRAMINAFIAKRQGEGRNPRTVNLGVTVLRNVLKRGIEDGWLKSLPTVNLKPLKYTPRRRELVTADDIKKLCDAAVQVSKKGCQFADYIWTLAYSGARMAEAMRLKWQDVNWQQKQLTIGADGLAKNGKARVVDMNPKLAAHLQKMHDGRAPDTDWIFPSPLRGEQDVHLLTFRETLKLARTEANLPKFGFHDARHYFASMCVMSGLDFMTIARWLGHQDGGILIGKVYGHLSNEHAQRQAKRIKFDAVVERSAPQSR